MRQAKDTYDYWVKFAARVSVSVALLLLVLKLFAWFDSEASVMLATATDSLLDLFASLVNLFILKVALLPPDHNHKFGHGKAESLGSLFQAAFITGSAILLILNGVDRVINPVELVKTDIALGVTVVTIAATLLLVAFQTFVVKKTGSLAINADMLHYKSDLLLNVAVLIALIFSHQFWPSADGVFTVAIGGYLLLSAFNIVRQSLDQLMDKELSELNKRKILKVVTLHEKALGVHNLKTRQSGPMTFIQLHLELDENLSLLDAHTVGEEIEQELLKLFESCEVLIHHDPISIVNKKE